MPMVDERAALPQAEGVLLWSMRTWVLGLCRDLEVAPRIRTAFAGLQAEDAAPGLDGFMRALQAGTVRTLDVETMCTTRVSADERALIGVFARIQAGDVPGARHALDDMIAPAMLAGALDGADCVSAALAEAGHVLHEPALPPAAAGRGTLH